MSKAKKTVKKTSRATAKATEKKPPTTSTKKVVDAKAVSPEPAKRKGMEYISNEEMIIKLMVMNTVTNARIDRIVEALSKSKNVKGL